MTTTITTKKRSAAALSQLDMIAHSPLPWKVREETDHYPAYLLDKLGVEVAAIFGDTREQRAANAALIVASVNKKPRATK
jgi:hypothetical protein